MKKIRAVLFDLDDTLINRREMIRRFASLFVERYLPDRTDRREYVRLLLELDDNGNTRRPQLFYDFFGRLGAELPPVEELLHYWNTVLPACLVEMPGLWDVLTTLRAAGLKLALVTNGGTELQGGKILRAGLQDSFDEILISGAYGMHKPDRRLFETALDLLCVGANEALFVGDNLINDIYGAQNAGIRAVWINPYVETMTGPSEPFAQIRSLSELPVICGAETIRGGDR